MLRAEKGDICQNRSHRANVTKAVTGVEMISPECVRAHFEKNIDHGPKKPDTPARNNRNPLFSIL